MRRSDFYYDLPETLIAQYPSAVRGDSRLLYLDKLTGQYADRKFCDLVDLVNAGDLLVFNDTRVIPARLFGHKETGGRVEILIERLLADGRVLAQVRASKSPKPGNKIELETGIMIEVVKRRDDFHVLELTGKEALVTVLEQAGHMPLPPYIKRQDEPLDRERYQTVYARQPGAVAAPTAGLHFSTDMLQKLEERGVTMGFVTLHVGVGTFQPVRSNEIEDHTMHSEWFEVSRELCAIVDSTRKQGGRVIAVGTTAVRSLESAAVNGVLCSQRGETDLFIYPGYEFRVVDALLTNFHLPESTLLMLVCAFAGRGPVLQAYAHAVNEKYHFFSYGDAMFISERVRGEGGGDNEKRY